MTGLGTLGGKETGFHWLGTPEKFQGRRIHDCKMRQIQNEAKTRSNRGRTACYRNESLNVLKGEAALRGDRDAARTNIHSDSDIQPAVHRNSSSYDIYGRLPDRF